MTPSFPKNSVIARIDFPCGFIWGRQGAFQGQGLRLFVAVVHIHALPRIPCEAVLGNMSEGRAIFVAISFGSRSHNGLYDLLIAKLGHAARYLRLSHSGPLGYLLGAGRAEPAVIVDGVAKSEKDSPAITPEFSFNAITNQSILDGGEREIGVMGEGV